MNMLSRNEVMHKTTLVSGHASAEQSRRAHGRDSADIRLALLAQAIEHEIIPRLMMAHRTPHICMERAAGGVSPLVQSDVEHFAKLVVSQDDRMAQACIDTMRARGISVETIYLDLLAPVARHLGHLWDQDMCDFTDVTIGLGRLHQVLRELSPAFGHAIDNPGNGRHILLLPGPREQHTFGLVMVSEFFRRAGWDVAGGPRESGVDPVMMVRREWFDIVGFSLAAISNLEDLRICIADVRAESMNPRIGVMVGGPVFGLNPDHAEQVGADCATAEGRDAPDLALSIIDRLCQTQ